MLEQQTVLLIGFALGWFLFLIILVFLDSLKSAFNKNKEVQNKIFNFLKKQLSPTDYITYQELRVK